jgi:hypothetical protein
LDAAREDVLERHQTRPQRTVQVRQLPSRAIEDELHVAVGDAVVVRERHEASERVGAQRIVRVQQDDDVGAARVDADVAGRSGPTADAPRGGKADPWIAAQPALTQGAFVVEVVIGHDDELPVGACLREHARDRAVQEAPGTIGRDHDGDACAHAAALWSLHSSKRRTSRTPPPPAVAVFGSAERKIEQGRRAQGRDRRGESTGWSRRCDPDRTASA